MKREISLKWKYWFNYLTIAMIACAVVGLSIYAYSMKRLEDTLQKSMAVELSTAATWLDEQILVLQDIAGRIAGTYYYQHVYRDAGVAGKRRITESLQRFADYTPLSQNYFLYYRGENQVWKPGALNTFDYYANLELKAVDAPALYAFLNGMQSLSVFPINDRFLILAIPMCIESGRRAEYDAVFSFCLDRRDVLKQLEIYAPTLSGALRVYFGETPLLNDAVREEEVFATGEDGLLHSGTRMAADSRGRWFRIVMDPKEVSVFSYTGAFRRVNLVILGLSAVILGSLCYLLAARNYRPIQEMLRRHQIAGGTHFDELARIDALLAHSSLSESLFQEQAAELRRMQEMLTRQFFLTLLGGGLAHNAEERAGTIGIPFCGELFQVHLLRFQNEVNMLEAIPAVQDMSDASLRLFCVPLNGAGECAVIVNTDEEAMLPVAEDLLAALNGADGSVRFAFVKASALCEGLNALSGMLSSLPQWSDASSLPELSPQESRRTAAQMMSALQRGSLQDAVETFAAFLRVASPLPDPQRRFACAEVVITLLEMGEECADNALRVLAAQALNLRDEGALLRHMEMLLLEMCTRMRARRTVAQEDGARQVIRFIDANLADSGLDVASVARALSLSQKGIREAIRGVAECSPREYFNRRRVENAKRLLAESNLLITEISDRVGYGSVSYFIKNFRALAGMTPAAYRECRNHSVPSEEKIRILRP